MTPRFSFLFTLLVSLLLLVEPSLLRADWSSVGTWFWLALGAVGLIGWVLERFLDQRTAQS